MKNHFPFTDYDFYAYLASGGFLLVVIDYVFNNALLLSQNDWSFIQIVVAVTAAYVTGHIIAMLAQTLLETLIVSKVLSKPICLQLGFVNPNWLEKLIGALVGRYYSSLPTSAKNKILTTAAAEFGKPAEEITDAEDVFLLGFRKSFDSDKARTRIDDFRNQYGFCRNIAFVALVAFALLIWKAATCSGTQNDWYLGFTALFVFIAMFVRFVKFLAAFQAEVICQIK